MVSLSLIWDILLNLMIKESWIENMEEFSSWFF